MKVFLVLLACLIHASVTHAQFFRPKKSSTRCQNPNNRPGTCVSIYDCQTLISVLQRTPLQQHDVSFVKSSECKNGYGSGPYVCCAADTGFTRQNSPYDYDYDESSNNWSDRTTFLFPSNNFGENPQSPTLPLHRQQRAGSSISSTRALAPLPEPPTCGGVTIENKIYGGSDAELNEFPWMVLLEYNRRAGGNSVSCAGALISQRYVLTAAHCVKGDVEKQIGELVAVRLGEYDLTRQIDCNQYSCAPEAYRVGIEEIIPHDLYTDNSPNKENDIALVRLERNVRFSDNVRPICMPSVISETAPSSSQYTVAGWGRTLNSPKSAVKQKLNVVMVDQEKCRSRFKQRKVNIVGTQLCAGGKFAEDSCEGDSGAPLMRLRGGSWVIEGVVSFGFRCGLKDWPAVHTRVESYDEWIRSKIRL